MKDNYMIVDFMFESPFEEMSFLIDLEKFFESHPSVKRAFYYFEGNEDGK